MTKLMSGVDWLLKQPQLGEAMGTFIGWTLPDTPKRTGARSELDHAPSLALSRLRHQSLNDGQAFDEIIVGKQIAGRLACDRQAESDRVEN